MLLVSFMSRCLTRSCCKLSSGRWTTSNKSQSFRGVCSGESRWLFRWWLFVNPLCWCVSVMKVMALWYCTSSDRPHEHLWPLNPVSVWSESLIVQDETLRSNTAWLPCHWKTCECQRDLKSWFPGLGKSTLISKYSNDELIKSESLGVYIVNLTGFTIILFEGGL